MVTRPAEAFENASQMLGHYLRTKQTPPNGLLVKKLYIYKAEDVAHEYYVAVTFDRQQSSPVLLISGEGGVNVESKADQLHRFWFSPSRGVTPDLLAAVRSRLLFSTGEMPIIERIIQQLVKLFVEKDAILLELNPLVLTTDGRFVCLDAKFDLDDAARFRQQGLYSLEEPTPDLAEEQEASRHGLVYIRLDGNIGNVVNGAGLAMATNDLINLHGGKSANFLDIGGKATGETLWQAVEMLNRDPHVQGMWINIFGGTCPAGGEPSRRNAHFGPRDRAVRHDCPVDCRRGIGHGRVQDARRRAPTGNQQRRGPANRMLLRPPWKTTGDDGLTLVVPQIQKSGMDLHTESDFELAARRIIELTPRSG